MNVLIIGNGGREHALAWKIAQSPIVEHVFVAPGNGGTHLEPHCRNVDIDATDFETLIQFAHNNAIALTVVGPEAPLANGIVDAFQNAGLPCFGPTQAGAQLEASKSYCKQFMDRYHIPTAGYRVFTDAQEAKMYVSEQAMPIVIKADGLAAGKGVIIATSHEQAHQTLDDILNQQQFGAAGARVVIEQFLSGVEVSFIVMTDGQHILPLATSQDHKRLLNNDLGPNTGGMGAYSPAPMVTPTLHNKILREVIEPTIAGLAQDGIPYCGFLYAGLMISPEGAIHVLEYNCRLGDPETQPIMMRLQSDLVTLCQAALEGKLDQVSAQWSEQCALGVVLANKGYPDHYPTGDPIGGLDSPNGTQQKIFHAGTLYKEGQIVSQGGRVLCATALGDDFQQAQHAAYELIQQVEWANMTYRTDIGYQVV